MVFKMISNFIIHAFYPSRCPYCNNVIFKNTESCGECAKIIEINKVVTPLYQSRSVSPFKYDGINKKAVLGFKFYNNPDYSESFAVSIQKVIADEYSQCFSDEKRFDIITSVPITKKRYYERGYNQSSLLAKQLGELLDIKFIPLLQKIKDTEPQHTLPKNKRRKNVEGVFRLNPKYTVKDKNILLIDDILTTGSTLNECIATLYQNGAKQVLCSTYATATREETNTE